jgi:hypothetical protein
MATNRPYSGVDVLGRSFANADWITGRALQEAIGGLAMSRMLGVQKTLAEMDFSTLFPAVSRINSILASLPTASLVSPTLLRFDELTRQLNRTLLPVMPDLAHIGVLAADSQRRLLGTVSASLRPFSQGLPNLLSPELLDSLRFLGEQLAAVQDDPDAADAALERAAQATPSLRPLVDWLRENQHLAGWAALVFMMIFFVTEQVQRDPSRELQLPAGSVLIVPGESGVDTATVTVEMECR